MRRISPQDECPLLVCDPLGTRSPRVAGEVQPPPASRTSGEWPAGLPLTGGDKLVIRGGYARTHDYQFQNLVSNVAKPRSLSRRDQSSDAGVGGRRDGHCQRFCPPARRPADGQPDASDAHRHGRRLSRATADQFSLELQRQLTDNFVLRMGYVGTKGSGLFQTLEGNPRVPFSTQRQDPSRGYIRVRANTGESSYHSLQLSGEQRISRGFTGGFHYTWSSFIDDGSDVGNTSVGEVGTPQDPYDTDRDRGRPHTTGRTG